MDIQLARTFLEVVAAGSFVAAARRLHVTQSAVSLRIRSLEQQLGRSLFVRNKSGAELTAAGQQFERYATAMLKVWEEARQQVAIPRGYRTSLVVGGQYSLWDRLLLRWLTAIRARAPDIALRAEVGMPARLIREMVEGIIDIGVMYTPQLRPGLDVEPLLQEELVLVSANPGARPELDDSYVFVDWGPGFRTAHALHYPDYTNPGMTLSLGALGVGYIVENGGTGYFPTRVVQKHLTSGRLTLVPEAPIFPYPAYVVYHVDTDPEALSVALDELRHIAARIDEEQHSVVDELMPASAQAR